MSKRIAFILILSILLFTGKSFCKLTDPIPDSTKKSDTVCFKYKFTPGDTLYYYVVSYDSIIIDKDEPLLKKRYERTILVCDSIKNNNRYFLTQELITYLGYESKGNVRNVERDEHPWKGRKVWYEIDSLGNRYTWGYDDTTNAVLSPGGGFQPYLIFPLAESCKKINESWNVSSLDVIPENGLPMPILRQSSLLRARDFLDTLDEHCKRFEYIKTGQGSLQIKSGGESLLVTNVINGYGEMYFSSVNDVPVYYMGKVEQKLKLKFADESEKPGFHFIVSTYTLEKYVPGKKINDESFKKQHGNQKNQKGMRK